MPNLYILLALVIGWGASVVGAGWWGIGIGEDRTIATQAKVNKAIDETRAAAQEGAANAIAQIKITNTTIRGRVETVVREVPTYRDCKHDAGVLRNVNSALANKQSQPADPGKLPTVVAPR